MSIQGEVENCLAWECAGCAKSDLPKDRRQLKHWHRTGKINDINSFTQSDIDDTANKVINIMKRQLNVGMMFGGTVMAGAWFLTIDNECERRFNLKGDRT